MLTTANIPTNFAPANYQPTRLHELVYSKLSEMNTREIMLIYEMIQLLHPQKKPTRQVETPANFPFDTIQKALKNVHGSMSDEIIPSSAKATPSSDVSLMAMP